MPKFLIKAATLLLAFCLAWEPASACVVGLHRDPSSALLHSHYIPPVLDNQALVASPVAGTHYTLAPARSQSLQRAMGVSRRGLVSAGLATLIVGAWAVVNVNRMSLMVPHIGLPLAYVSTTVLIWLAGLSTAFQLWPPLRLALARRGLLNAVPASQRMSVDQLRLIALANGATLEEDPAISLFETGLSRDGHLLLTYNPEVLEHFNALTVESLVRYHEAMHWGVWQLPFVGILPRILNQLVAYSSYALRAPFARSQPVSKSIPPVPPAVHTTAHHLEIPDAPNHGEMLDRFRSLLPTFTYLSEVRFGGSDHITYSKQGRFVGLNRHGDEHQYHQYFEVQPVTLQSVLSMLQRCQTEDILPDKTQLFLLDHRFGAVELRALAQDLPFEIGIEELANGQTLLLMGDADSVGDGPGALLLDGLETVHAIVDSYHNHPSLRKIFPNESSSSPLAWNLYRLSTMFSSPQDWATTQSCGNIVFTSAGITVWTVHPALATKYSLLAQKMAAAHLDAYTTLGIRLINAWWSKGIDRQDLNVLRAEHQAMTAQIGVYETFLTWDEIGERPLREVVSEMRTNLYRQSQAATVESITEAITALDPPAAPDPATIAGLIAEVHRYAAEELSKSGLEGAALARLKVTVDAYVAQISGMLRRTQTYEPSYLVQMKDAQIQRWLNSSRQMRENQRLPPPVSGWHQGRLFFSLPSHFRRGVTNRRLRSTFGPAVIAPPADEPESPARTWSVRVTVLGAIAKTLGFPRSAPPVVTLQGEGPLTGRTLADALRQKLGSPGTRFVTYVGDKAPAPDEAITNADDVTMVENIKGASGPAPATALDDEDLPYSPAAYLLKALGVDADALRAGITGEGWEKAVFTVSASQVDLLGGVFASGAFREGDAMGLLFQNGVPYALLTEKELPASLTFKAVSRRAAVLGESTESASWEKWVSPKAPFVAFPAFEDQYIAELGRSITVFSGVYSPRPAKVYGTFSNEALITSFPHVRGKRVGDAGSGTGILGLLALQDGAESVLAFDSNRLAVWNARWNARRFGYRHRLQVVQAEGLQYLPADAEPCDLWVSNVPVMATREVAERHYPGISPLDRRNWSDEEGLVIASLVRYGKRWLRPSPWVNAIHIVFYNRDEAELHRLADKYGWAVDQVPTLDNRDNYGRFVLRPQRARLGSAPELSTLTDVAGALLPALGDAWPSNNVISPVDEETYNSPSIPIAREDVDSLYAAFAQVWAERRGEMIPTVINFKAGSFSWIRAVETADMDLAVEVPMFDDDATTLKSRRDTVERNFRNFSYFWDKGLKRYLPRPVVHLGLTSSDERRLPISATEFVTGRWEMNFGEGAFRLWDHMTGDLHRIPARELPNFLAEVVAMIVYHSEAHTSGMTVPTDFLANNGDILSARREDDSFDLKLISMRDRREGVDRNIFIRSLIQLAAYEEMFPDDVKLVHLEKVNLWLPVLISNPSIAFEGLVRGLTYQYADLGLPTAFARPQAERWLAAFARSEEGRPYAPWVEHFLAGDLPLTFGQDPLEGHPTLELMHWMVGFIRQAKETMAEEREGFRIQLDQAEAYVLERIQAHSQTRTEDRRAA